MSIKTLLSRRSVLINRQNLGEYGKEQYVKTWMNSKAFQGCTDDNCEIELCMPGMWGSKGFFAHVVFTGRGCHKRARILKREFDELDKRVTAVEGSGSG